MKRLLNALAVAAVVSLAPPAFADSATGEDIYARQEALREIVTQARPDGGFIVRAPLAAFRAQQGGLILDGANAASTIYLPVSGGVKISSARLVLRHAASRAIADYAPHLKVEMNGQFVAQLDSATGLSAATDEISFSPDTFQPGFNALKLTAFQRYTVECQDPDAAELWTEIDTARSYLEITYDRRTFAAGLADLNTVITPAIGGVEALTIVTGDDTPEDQHLRWGAIGAQAIANRLDYKTPRITREAVSATDNDANMGPASGLHLENTDSDILVIGTFDELAGVIVADPADFAVGEAMLAIGPSPADASRFVIVIAGHDAQGVELALQALANDAFPFADTRQMRISALDAPRTAYRAKSAPLADNAAYTFADLGHATQTVIGQSSAAFDLPVDLPADWHVADDATVDLSLDFAYGAALSENSVLNIYVNDVFRRAIALDNPKGEAASRYGVSLPARSFSPGRNTLKLVAELNSHQQGHCVTRNPRNLAFVLEGSSLIRLPEADSYASLPNLNLMSRTGFPYSGVEEAGFSIQAATPSNRNMAATWTMAARLGQIRKSSFSDADFSFGATPSDQHTLIVGDRSNLGSLADGFTTLSPQATAGADGVLRRVTLNDLGAAGLVLAGRNPVGKDKLLTVVTAETDFALDQAVASLVAPSHWSQLDGGAAIWRSPAASFAAQTGSDSFYVGKLGAADRAAYHNAKAPWTWIATIAALLFTLAALLAGLARYMRSRMGER